MKTFYAAIILIAITGIFFIGCTESPVGPVNQTVSLDKKGPVVHRVTGSGLLFFNGKTCGARYSAREYADGTFDGDYEINGANATGDPTFKLNGNVISFTVYENVNEFNGEMAVFFGQEKTGPYAGWYDVFFAIDNGQPGEAPAPDQVNYYLLSLPTLEYVFWGMTIEQWAALSPAELITNLGIANCDQGNITIE